MTTQFLQLPYPKPPLSKNQRLHHMAVYRTRKRIRDDVRLIARAKHLHAVDEALITLHWRPAVARQRDEDNAFDTVKPCVDGLVDAGVLPGDHSDIVSTRVEIHPRQPGQPPALWLTIEPRETP
jgi:hypothetical protein